MDDYEPPTRVFGVDFSADRERAGERTWIAECAVDPTVDETAAEAERADGAGRRLRVVDCRRASDRLDAGRRRESAVPALTRLLGGLDGDAAVGLDFPFGLPAEVVAADRWVEFLRRLPGWADDPVDLARESAARATLEGDDVAGAAPGGETGGGGAAKLLRATDEPLGALSPYDRRLRAGTFYGIRDVLRPLVLADAARALPMQPLAADRPHLLEVYPAGTLDRLEGHATRYRSDDAAALRRRSENLDALEAAGVDLPEAVGERVLEDDDGDALDAVLAALAAARHTRDPTDLQVDDGERRLEGHIYV